jgi:hypothetical protein
MKPDQKTIDDITTVVARELLENADEHIAAWKQERMNRRLSDPDSGRAPSSDLGADIIPVVATIVSHVWEWAVANRDNIMAGLGTSVIVEVIKGFQTEGRSQLGKGEVNVIATLIAKELEERGVIPPREASPPPLPPGEGGSSGQGQ